MNPYHTKILNDVEAYVQRQEKHIPVDIVEKMVTVIALARHYRARVVELEDQYETRNPDAAKERDRPEPPQKFVQGSWVDA